MVGTYPNSALPEVSVMLRRAPLCLLTCLLCLVTATVLLRAEAIVGAPPSLAPSTRRSEDAVRGFYDAINAVLRTGDPLWLDSALASDFVHHGLLPNAATDRTALADYLAMLRGAFPQLQLEVTDLVVADDRAMVRVTTHGAERGTFLGLTLTSNQPVWSVADTFRLAGGRVAEFWSGAERRTFLTPLASVTLLTDLPSSAGLALERLTLSASTKITSPALDEGRLLLVEAGRLTVALGAATEVPAVLGGDGDPRLLARQPKQLAPGAQTTLVAGDLVFLPAASSVDLWTDADSPAIVLAAAVFEPGASRTAVNRSDPAYPAAASSWPADAIVDLLAGGTLGSLPVGPAIASFGRATLEPGAEFTTQGGTDATLVSVESGTLRLDANPGSVWVRDGETGASTATLVGSLAAGDGLLAYADTTLTLRNAGSEPVSMFVVTIVPRDPADGAGS